MRSPSITISVCSLALLFTSHAAVAKGAAEIVVYSFNNNTNDGTDPYGALVNMNGTLYGTTYDGGTQYLGAVFAIDGGETA